MVYYYIFVLILLYMCPHTAICVLILLTLLTYRTSPPTPPPSCRYISSVLILLYMCVSSYSYVCVCPHTTIYVCVLIPRYMCVSSYYYICVLILLHMWPHTTTYVSSYYYKCVLILLHTCPLLLHTAHKVGTVPRGHDVYCIYYILEARISLSAHRALYSMRAESSTYTIYSKRAYL